MNPGFFVPSLRPLVGKLKASRALAGPQRDKPYFFPLQQSLTFS